MQNNEPAHVDVSLSQGATIHWQDGHRSHWSVCELRAACPCATCTDAHQVGEAPTRVELSSIKDPAAWRLESAKPVGRYAVNFTFNDGHGSGIFTWEYLRGICPCSACHPLPSAPE